MTILRKAVLGVALCASFLTAAAPAEAQRWRRHRNNDAGIALAAGIAGLAIGAALTSRDRYDPRYDYDGRYYDRRGYFPNDGYYAHPYDHSYRGPRGYYNGCVVRRVYDPYLGRRVRVRYC